jgi:hypothetical protein
MPPYLVKVAYAELTPIIQGTITNVNTVSIVNHSRPTRPGTHRADELPLTLQLSARPGQAGSPLKIDEVSGIGLH